MDQSRVLLKLRSGVQIPHGAPFIKNNNMNNKIFAYCILCCLSIITCAGVLMSKNKNPVKEARKTFQLKHEAQVGMSDIYSIDVDGSKFIVWQGPTGVQMARTK